MESFILTLTLANSVAIYLLFKRTNIVLTGIQQGNVNRKWKGYWKIKPEDHKKIFMDKRSCTQIAKEYGCSPSHISQIKRNYANK